MPSTPEPKDRDAQATPSRRLSAHEDVPTWRDCCACEPEPRWQAVEEQLEREREQKASSARRR